MIWYFIISGFVGAWFQCSKVSKKRCKIHEKSRFGAPGSRSGGKPRSRQRASSKQGGGTGGRSTSSEKVSKIFQKSYKNVLKSSAKLFKIEVCRGSRRLLGGSWASCGSKAPLDWSLDTPSAVHGRFLSRLGRLLGGSWAVLSAKLGRLGASWKPLVPNLVAEIHHNRSKIDAKMPSHVDLLF